MKKYLISILSIVGLIIVILLVSLLANSNSKTSSDINSSDINIVDIDNNMIKGNDINMSDQNKNQIVVIETTKGNIEIELNQEKSPLTVKNFKSYVSGGFYDGTVFHRVIPGFMIQGGGFTSDGNQKATMPPIAIESNNGLSNLTGTIAMARTNDPNSATSQFFINVADNIFLNYSDNLNPGYTVFGKVISGLDVVYSIEKVPTTTKFGGYKDWPVDNVIITKIYLK